MESNMQARVKGYLELLGAIRQSVDSEETAARILSEIARDLRAEQIQRERANGNGNGNSGSKAATQRQLEYLRDLGVKVTPGITKQQASALITAEQSRSDEEADEETVVSSSEEDDSAAGGPYVERVETKASLADGWMWPVQRTERW